MLIDGRIRRLVVGHVGDIRGCSLRGLWVDSLTGEDCIEVDEVKGGDVALEEELALGKLELDAVEVAAGGDGVAVAVLLGAGDARGGTGRAAGVLGITLREIRMAWKLPSVSPGDLP